MTGILQPLDNKFAIVDGHGNPTDYFIRWAQQKQIDIGSSITLTDLTNYLAAHTLIAGTGIQLTPDGNIADGVTIHADAQAILDEITATRGAILYRGLLGWSALLPDTAGKVLSTNGAGADPSWITPASGGGGALVLLEQHTASGSATLDFTTGITATYDEYVFEFVDLVPATNAVNLWMRCSTNGGVSYDSSAIYDFVNNFYGSSAFNSNQSAENQAQIALIFSLGTTAGYSGSGKMKLYNPASASLYKQVDFHTACSASDNHFYTDLGAGRYRNTTAVNAIRFLMSSGNIASGVIRMYGIAKT